jgi:NAD(P)H-dependent FMN reductase
MAELYIPILLGSARQGRYSEKAARHVLAQFEAYGAAETELIDCKDYITPRTMPPWEKDRGIVTWGDKMARADALIIVSPEYNHGYPGELKLVLDQVYKECYHKPVAICGVSNGGLGGARMVEQLMLVLIAFHMAPIKSAVYFSFCEELFDASGALVADKREFYNKNLRKQFDELAWYARALKTARETQAD